MSGTDRTSFQANVIRQPLRAIGYGLGAMMILGSGLPLLFSYDKHLWLSLAQTIVFAQTGLNLCFRIWRSASTFDEQPSLPPHA